MLRSASAIRSIASPRTEACDCELRLRLRLRDGHAVEGFEAGVVRLLRTPELDLRRDERREHLVLLHGVARGDALHVADPAAHGGDDRIRPVLVGRHAAGRPQQPGAGRAADDAEPDADRLLPLGTHLHRAGRQRRGRRRRRPLPPPHERPRAACRRSGSRRDGRCGSPGASDRCRRLQRARSRAQPDRCAHHVPPANEPAARETARAVTAMMRFIGVASASARRQRGVRPAFVLPCHATVDRYDCTITRSSVSALRAIWDGPSRCLISVASAPSSTRARPAAPTSSSPGHQKRASATSSAMPVAYMNCRE